jgi:uncharacterized protein
MNILGILLMTLLPGAGVQGSQSFDRQLERFTQLAMEGKTQEAIVYLRLPGFLRAADREGHTALFAATVASNDDVLDLVLAAHPDLDHRDTHGATALFYAASQGRTEIVRRLIQHGADVNLPDADGRTPLMVAVLMDHDAATRLLLAAKAQVNVQDRYGSTALIDAVDGGHTELATLLLDRGANVRTARSDGSTPLQLARAHALPKMVALLQHEDAAD